MIYPTPTAVAEQSLCLLNADWVSPEQREGAQSFLAFLGSKEALQDGVKAGFRPAQNAGTLSLTPELERNAPQGFQETFTSVELPSYKALDEAAFQWRQEVTHRSVVRD